MPYSSRGMSYEHMLRRGYLWALMQHTFDEEHGWGPLLQQGELTADLGRDRIPINQGAQGKSAETHILLNASALTLSNKVDSRNSHKYPHPTGDQPSLASRPYRNQGHFRAPLYSHGE